MIISDTAPIDSIINKFEINFDGALFSKPTTDTISIQQMELKRLEKIKQWKKYQKKLQEQDSIKRFTYNEDTISYFLKPSTKEFSLTNNYIEAQLNIDQYWQIDGVKKQEKSKEIFITDTSYKPKASQTENNIDNNVYKTNNLDFSVLLLLLSVLILAIIRFKWKTYFSRLFTAQFNFREFLKLVNENNLLIRKMNTVLDFFMIIVFTVFVKEIYFNSNHSTNILLIYIAVPLCLISFLLFSRGLKFVIGFASNESEVFSQHNYSFNLSLRLLAVVFLPITISMSFAGQEVFEIMVVASLLLLTITFLYNSIRLLKLFRQKGVSSLLCIMYLCALEILPMLMIFSYVARQE